MFNCIFLLQTRGISKFRFLYVATFTLMNSQTSTVELVTTTSTDPDKKGVLFTFYAIHHLKGYST